MTVISNIFYPIAGYFGNEVTFIAGLVLMFGSSWMHYNRTPNSILADWYGMYAMSLSTLALLTSTWVLALLIPIGLLRHDIRNEYLIGAITLIAVLIDENLYSLVAFGLAYGIRTVGHGTDKEDITHSIWHVLTATAYYFLLI